MDEVLVIRRPGSPHHHPAPRCVLGTVGGHTACGQTDVAVAGNDPRITKRCQDPASQTRIQSQLADPATLDHLPIAFRDSIAINLGSSQDRGAPGLVGGHLGDLRPRVLGRNGDRCSSLKPVSHGTERARAASRTRPQDRPGFCLYRSAAPNPALALRRQRSQRWGSEPGKRRSRRECRMGDKGAVCCQSSAA